MSADRRPAILLNTPGESASIMSSLDGHAMALSGARDRRLATAAIGSFVAGTFATAASHAQRTADGQPGAALVGPRTLALSVLAFMAVSCVLGDSIARGLASLMFGLCLGLIGIDPPSGCGRGFTSGVHRNCSARHRRRHRIDAGAVSAAIGGAVRRDGVANSTGIGVGDADHRIDPDDTRGLEAVVEAVVAGDRDRTLRSARCPDGRGEFRRFFLRAGRRL